jgi:hypothetical protein
MASIAEPADAAQRVSRPGLRDSRRDGRAGHPQAREGQLLPELPGVAEKALTAVIQEAYVQGISTRSVDALVKALGMAGVSKSQASRLCESRGSRVDKENAGALERSTVRSYHWMPWSRTGSNMLLDRPPARPAGTVTCQFVNRLAVAYALPLPRGVMPHARVAYLTARASSPKPLLWARQRCRGAPLWIRRKTCPAGYSLP